MKIVLNIAHYLLVPILLMLQVTMVTFAGQTGDVNQGNTIKNSHRKLHHKYQVLFPQPLKFGLIGGAPGKYRQIQKGKCIVYARHPVQINFSATDLSAKGSSKFLDVTYWVNDPQNAQMSFRPNSPALSLYKKGCHCYEFTIYGEITINRISKQPMGDYQGAIKVTVTKR